MKTFQQVTAVRISARQVRSVVEMGLIYTTFGTEHEILHIPNSGLLNAALRAPAVPNSLATPADRDVSHPVSP